MQVHGSIPPFTAVTESGGSCFCRYSGTGTGDPNTWPSSGFCNAGTYCQSGYTLSGGSCSLTNSAAVIKPGDGKCEIKRVGNSFSGDPNDPDCLAGPDNAMQQVHGNATGGTVTAAGLGQAVEVAVDGGTGAGTVTSSKANSNGTTTTTTIHIGAPGSGAGEGGAAGTAVTGTTVATYEGTGSNVSGTPLAKPDAREPCGLPGTPACKIDESGTPTDGSLSDAKAAYETAAAARKTQLESVNSSLKKTDLGLSLSVSWPSGSCSDLAVNIDGHSGSFDLCSKQADIKAITSWLMGILTAFALLFIGTGALTRE